MSTDKAPEWIIKTPEDIHALGYIPQIIWGDPERSVAQQVDDRYAHGGGWMPFDGFEVTTGGYLDPQNLAIKHPGDPLYEVRAWAYVGKELVAVFPYSWVMVMQPDGRHQISRMD